MKDEYGNVRIGPIVVMAIIVFLVTMGTMFLYTEYQSFKARSLQPMMFIQNTPYPIQAQTQVPVWEIPKALNTLTYNVQAIGPTVDSMATHSVAVTQSAQTAVAQINQYNQQQAAQASVPQLQKDPVSAPAGPALVPYEACRDTRAYSTTNDADENYIGFVPKGTTIFFEARSSDGLWIKIHAPGAASEWWTPATNICQ